MQPKASFLMLDGPTGTELITRGYQTHPVLWTARASLERPDLLRQIHLDYLRAGADILTANTFRSSGHSVEKAGIEAAEARRMAHSAVAIATEAIEEMIDATGDAAGDSAVGSETRPRFLAGSLGPLEDCYQPRLAPPLEVMEREHLRTAGWLVEAGCQLILAETMGTAREARAATIAARRAGAPSVNVSFIPDETGTRTLGGDSLLDAARACAEEGADTILVNCAHHEVISQALAALAPLRESGVVLGAYANGSRRTFGFDGQPQWEADPRPESERSQEYAQAALSWHRKLGAKIIGSCCGTTPEFIRATRAALSGPG